MLTERAQGEPEPLTMRTWPLRTMRTLRAAISRPYPHLQSCVGRRLRMGDAGKLGTRGAQSKREKHKEIGWGGSVCWTWWFFLEEAPNAKGMCRKTVQNREGTFWNKPLIPLKSHLITYYFSTGRAIYTQYPPIVLSLVFTSRFFFKTAKLGFPCGLLDKTLPASAGDIGSIPGPGSFTCLGATKPVNHSHWARPPGAPAP